MPNGFRWKDEAISDDEYARRRELIRLFYKRANDAIAMHHAKQAALVYPQDSGFSDERYAAEVLAWEKATSIHTSAASVHQSYITFLIDVFGQHEFDHAMDEGEQKIGSLPYAKD